MEGHVWIDLMDTSVSAGKRAQSLNFKNWQAKQKQQKNYPNSLKIWLFSISFLWLRSLNSCLKVLLCRVQFKFEIRNNPLIHILKRRKIINPQNWILCVFSDQSLLELTVMFPSVCAQVILVSTMELVFRVLVHSPVAALLALLDRNVKQRLMHVTRTLAIMEQHVTA